MIFRIRSSSSVVIAGKSSEWLCHKRSPVIIHPRSRSASGDLLPSSDGILQRAPQARGRSLAAQAMGANDVLANAYAAVGGPDDFPHPVFHLSCHRRKIVGVALPQEVSRDHPPRVPLGDRSPTSPPSSDGILQRAPQTRGRTLAAQTMDANDFLANAYAAAGGPDDFPHPVFQLSCHRRKIVGVALPQEVSRDHPPRVPLGDRSPTSPPSSDGILQRAPQTRGRTLAAQAMDANGVPANAYVAAPSPNDSAAPHRIRCEIQPRFKPPCRRPPRTSQGGQEKGRNTLTNPSR